MAVCYEAGPGGFALWRLLTKLGVACDVVAPSLIPVRAGDRVEVDPQLVGMVEVLRADRMRVEVDAAEVDDPGELRGVAGRDAVAGASARPAG